MRSWEPEAWRQVERDRPAKRGGGMGRDQERETEGWIETGKERQRDG